MSRAAGPLRLFLVLGGLSALGPGSMDIYVPALPSMADDLGASASAAQLTIGLFLLGLGLGQLITGPLSDVYGRRRPMLAALVLYGLASAACAASPSIATLMLARLAQGMAAASGVVIARAMVRDLYGGAEAARYLSRLVLVYGLAPIIAPLIGGQLLRFTSWRGIFVFVVGVALVLLAATALLLPETLPQERRRPADPADTARTFAELLSHRRFVGYGLTLGFGTAAIAAYVAGAPFVLQDVYGVSPQAFGLFFGLNAVAMVIGSQVNAQLVTTVDPRRMLRASLVGGIAAGVALVLAVLLDLGLWGVAPCLLVLMGFWGFVPANSIALGMAEYPQVAGSASALLGVFQYAIAAVGTPLVGLGGRDTALPMAVVVLTLGLLSALCVHTLTRTAPLIDAIPEEATQAGVL